MKKYLSIALILFSLFVFAASSKAEQEKAPIYVLSMDGAIGPAFSAYLNEGLEKAK